MRYPLQEIASRMSAAVLALGLFGSNWATGWAQEPITNPPWRYRLLNDSSLLDDCLICGRPSIQVPMRGTFSLRLIEQNVISARWAIEDIQFHAGDRPYRVTGGGTLEIGGEVAVTLR